MATTRLVLVHGGAVDHRAWAPLIERLGHGWDVVAETRPPLDRVVGALGDGAVLVGASAGGGLALDAALSQPGAVIVLVLICPLVPSAPVTLDAARMQALMAAADAGPAAFADAVLEDPWFAVGVPAEGRAGLRAMLEANAPRQLGRQPWSTPVHSAADVASLPMPATVLVGERDDPANHAMSRWLATTLTRGRLEVVGGAGHLVELVRPDVVADAIVASAAPL